MNPNSEIQKPMVQNISCILPQTQQLGGLYLGNVFGAQNAPILKEYGIRAIITASAQTKINHSLEDIPFHLKIDAHDKDQYYIIEHVNECIHFIEQNRKFTNVFVHCYAGVSRSSAIVAAYLMWKYRWPLEKTISFLVFKRVVAKPNDGFYNQLKQVQTKLNIAPQNGNQSNTSKLPKEQQNIPKSNPLNEVLLVKKPSITKAPAPLVQKPQSPPLQIQNFNNSGQQFYTNKPDPYMMQLQNSNLMKTSPFISNSREQKQQIPQNYGNVPIPKVLAKRQQQNQYNNNDYYEKQVDYKGRTTIYNDYMSPEVQPTSPRLPKGFITNNANRNNTNYSATKEYTQTKYSINNSSNGLNGSKKGFESQQKAKTGSRCIIRPKDLPGYKNY